MYSIRGSVNEAGRGCLPDVQPITRLSHIAPMITNVGKRSDVFSLRSLCFSSSTASCDSRRTLEFSGARSVSAATPCSAACQSTPPVVQLTQSVIPATRKPFQLPSGIFLYTMSTLPRRCTGAPPGDVINETVYGRHSTAQPPSRKINSLYSGT